MYDRYFKMRLDFDDMVSPTLGETGMGVERLFVYLEVARALEVPASLARTKYKALKAVGDKSKTIASVIEKAIAQQKVGAKTGIDEVQDILQKNALPEVKLHSPLLPSHLMRVAHDRKCSILDAVKLIREDEAGIAFREYVWEARRAFDPVWAGDHFKKKEIEQRLADLGQRIKKGNSYMGAYKDMREITVNTSNILLLGSLLKMVGADLGRLEQAFRILGFKHKLRIPATIPLNPPLYEVFMARWFR